MHAYRYNHFQQLQKSADSSFEVRNFVRLPKLIPERHITSMCEAIKWYGRSWRDSPNKLDPWFVKEFGTSLCLKRANHIRAMSDCFGVIMNGFSCGSSISLIVGRFEDEILAFVRPRKFRVDKKRVRRRILGQALSLSTSVEGNLTPVERLFPELADAWRYDLPMKRRSLYTEQQIIQYIAPNMNRIPMLFPVSLFKYPLPANLLKFRDRHQKSFSIDTVNRRLQKIYQLVVDMSLVVRVENVDQLLNIVRNFRKRLNYFLSHLLKDFFCESFLHDLFVLVHIYHKTG